MIARNSDRNRTAASYQSLEDRRLLAGNVIVFENLHLYIRGDSADNQIELVAEGDQLRINGLDGTTINFQDSYTIKGGTVTDSGIAFAGGLRANLGRGNDTLEVRDAQFEDFSIVYGGEGDDQIDLIDSHFSDQALVQTYYGDDSITTDGSQFDDIFWALTLDGEDTVTMLNTKLNGGSIVATGDHDDSIHSDGSHYLGDLNLILPLDGDDTVQLDNPVVGELQLGVYLGNGDDTILGDMSDATIDGTIQIGGQAGTDYAWDMNMPGDSNVSMFVEYNLGYDSGTGGVSGVTGAFSMSYFNSQTDNYRLADDIRVESTETFNRISWSGTYSGTKTGEGPFEQDDFTIEIFEGNSIVPTGTPIASFNVGNNVDRKLTDKEIPLTRGRTYPIFSYSADIDLTLESGKTYWISIWSATEDEVPEGVLGSRYSNFQWAGGGGATDSNFVYTFGQQGFPNPGWFNDFGPGTFAYDFQLWV
jgi:hypothetical protein